MLVFYNSAMFKKAYKEASSKVLRRKWRQYNLAYIQRGLQISLKYGFVRKWWQW